MSDRVPAILFSDADVRRPAAFRSSSTRLWLLQVAELEQRNIEQVQYVFCSDAFLLELNQAYLDHDTLTDVLTFPYNYDPISAEIYISLDRIKDNARIYNGRQSLMVELHRVIVHGLLHMCGFKDDTDGAKEIMRAKEELYLKRLYPERFNI